MKSLFFAIILAAIAIGVKSEVEFSTAKITVKAVDEQGQSVSGATVTIGFEPPNPQWGSSTTVNTQGQTDINGEFSASGPSLDTLGGRVRKQGYYVSWSKNAKFTQSVAGRWQPWNPTLQVVLKKIVNPIPMYAKSVRTYAPAVNQDVGYDLEVGDWVAPAGKGKINDLIFNLTGYWNSISDNDLTLTITFSNKGDGIQPIIVPNDGSLNMLRLPRIAPDTGYLPKLQLRSSAKILSGQSETVLFSPNRDMNYFFRVRSLLGNNGKIVGANYGKIHGDIVFGSAKMKNFYLMIEDYYLNPTSMDRNVEFDPSHNLFPQTFGIERVQDP
jgi:hypothetical protein